jgi:hypothetical protein
VATRGHGLVTRSMRRVLPERKTHGPLLVYQSREAGLVRETTGAQRSARGRRKASRGKRRERD